MAIKRLDEYTNEELLELTEEQVKTLIDFECAHEGVALLPAEAPVKPAEEKVQPDTEIYEVSGLDYFKSHEDAKKVADLAASFERIDTVSGGSYTKKIAGISTTDVRVSIVKAYSESHYAKIATENARIDANLKAYKEAKAKFDEIQNSRSDITEGVLAKLGDARQEKQMINTLMAEAARYISLAQGEKEIAKNFMVHARPNQKEMIDEHFESWVVSLVSDKMRSVDTAAA